eukprot:10990322-Lingulodinium_polyedra.AAC.1
MGLGRPRHLRPVHLGPLGRLAGRARGVGSRAGGSPGAALPAPPPVGGREPRAATGRKSEI